MKKLLLVLLPVAAMLIGCKYDDSEVWNELDSQNERITALENTVSTLKSNLGSLQSIVSAMQNNLSVTAVKTTDDGYAIYFSDGTTATIKNGSDAHTPKFGAKKAADGFYYWTLDGEWMTDPSGAKVPAGATPQVKIENDQWMVSYDNGKSWMKVDGQGAAASCVFESVTTDASNVTFKLNDGSELVVPLANGTGKLQLIFDESVFATMHDGELISTTYTINAAEGATVDLQTFESNGWKVTVYPADDRSGRISIKAPEKASPTKVLFILADDNGGSFVKIINIGYSDEAKPPVKTEYVVDPNGGELIIPVNSCTADIGDAGDWMEVVEVGDRVVLNVTANESYDYRNATLILEDGTAIAITQVTRDAIVLSKDVVEIDGRRQKVNFVANANVTVAAKVIEGSEWLSVSPATRGLSEKVFTFTATRNTTGEERTAKVEFTGGENLSKVCTVIQAIYEGPDEIDVTEAIATEEGEEINLRTSLVVALTSDGYMVSDGVNAILVSDSDNKPAIGDSVSFGALSAVFNGITSLSDVEVFTTASKGNAFNYPTATNITGSVDSFDAEVPTFVTVTGDLTVTGGTCNLAVEGATTKVVIYKPAKAVGIEALSGHNVTVTGYYYGSTNGTMYIIAVRKTDNGSSITEGTQVTVSEFIKYAKEDMKLKLKGTVSNFNSQYCSFDLTDETGTIYVYSVDNKSDWTSKIKNGGTVELLGYYKNYNSKDEVVNAEILSFTGGGGGGTTTGYAYKKVTSVTSGKSYLIGAVSGTSVMVAKPITSNYGYLQVESATEKDGEIALASRDNEFVITQSGSGYTIVQKDGRYLYQTGSYNSFNVNASPTDGQYWTITSQSGGTFKITNTSVSKYVQYSTGFKSFGSYASDQDGSIMPTLYEYVGETTIDGDDQGGDDGGGSSDVTGDVETIDFTAQGYTNAQEIVTFKGSVVTITFDKGSNRNTPKYYTTGTAIRVYGGNTFTVSVTGKTIKAIEMTFSSGEGTNAITSDTGSYSDGKWTGSASSVTFTVDGTSGHRRLKTIAVTFSD